MFVPRVRLSWYVSHPWKVHECLGVQGVWITKRRVSFVLEALLAYRLDVRVSRARVLGGDALRRCELLLRPSQRRRRACRGGNCASRRDHKDLGGFLCGGRRGRSDCRCARWGNEGWKDPIRATVLPWHLRLCEIIFFRSGNARREYSTSSDGGDSYRVNPGSERADPRR